jgi:small subunit ribosomal protein S8e
MAIWHLKSKRKPSGGLLLRSRKKKRSDRGSIFVETKIGPYKAKLDRVRGGIVKKRLFSIDTANISDKTGKVVKAKILSVVDNPANPADYRRRNIITKGAIIKTEIGIAKVTSRPCQDGVVNAVLIEKKI